MGTCIASVCYTTELHHYCSTYSLLLTLVSYSWMDLVIYGLTWHPGHELGFKTKSRV